MGCNGGDEDQAMDYARDFGMMSEASYPYVAVDQDCAYDKNNLTPVKPTGHTLVKPNVALAVKTAIAAGPVSVAIEADTTVFQSYTSGIITSAACGTTLDHGVLAVGFGTENGVEYIIVKNSWGASWGENGFVRLGVADGAGICGINQSASIPKTN